MEQGGGTITFPPYPANLQCTCNMTGTMPCPIHGRFKPPHEVTC